MMAHEDERKRLLVVAGLIAEAADATAAAPLLITRRGESTGPEALRGLWEFPGGKVEPGEEPRAALAREIAEELGVRVEVGAVRETLHSLTATHDIILLFYACRLVEGEPRAIAVAEWRWVAPAELPSLPFIPADRPFVERLATEASAGRSATEETATKESAEPDARDWRRRFAEAVAYTHVLDRGEALLRLSRDLYWKRRDLVATLEVLTTAYALLEAEIAAQGDGDAATRYKMQRCLKSLAYDIGSFTYPGWDEPGIAIDAAQQALGRAYAARNLALAVELEVPPIAQARAHWLVGAHELAVEAPGLGDGDDRAALARGAILLHFIEAHGGALKAGEMNESGLYWGYIEMTHALSADSPEEEAAARDSLELTLDTLREDPDGAGWIEQLKAADRYFSARRAGLK